MVRPGRDRLAGNVEVDVVYWGGERPDKRGRRTAGKTLVLIAAPADGTKVGRIRLVRVANASSPALGQAIAASVTPGSLSADRWLAQLRRLASSWPPACGGARGGGGGRESAVRANRVAALLQRWLPGTHQGAVAAAHLDYYLDEFAFRFNRRTSGSRGLLFERLGGQALQLSPVRGDALVGGTEPQDMGHGESSA